MSIDEGTAVQIWEDNIGDSGIAPTDSELHTFALLIEAQVRKDAWQSIEIEAAQHDEPKREDESQIAFTIRLLHSEGMYKVAQFLRGEE